MMNRDEAISVQEWLKNNDLSFLFDETRKNIGLSADMAIEALKREQLFLEAGYKGKEVEFYIGGRRFAVRELAQ